MTVNDAQLHQWPDSGATLLRLAEVAAILRIDPSTLRRWVRRGVLAAVRPVGARGTVRIERSEVERLLAESRSPTSPEHVARGVTTQ